MGSLIVDGPYSRLGSATQRLVETQGENVNIPERDQPCHLRPPREMRTSGPQEKKVM